MKEIWETIPYEPTHEVSNLGRFRNKQSFKKWGIRTRVGTKNTKGYLRIKFNNGKTYMAHRIVADVFLPKKDNSRNEINHKNFNRSDNRVDNLEWVNHSENIKHSMDSGQYKKRVRIVNTKEVLNKTTGEIFDSVRLASEKYKVSYGAIKHSILNHNKCCNCDWVYTGNFKKTKAVSIKIKQ